MAPASGVWAPIAMRVLRQVYKKTSKLIKTRFADANRPLNSELHPILVRKTHHTGYPIRPAAFLRQSNGRWYTTQNALNAAIRRLMSSGATSGVKFDRLSFPKSSVGIAVSRLTSQAPFASTLRPNLTGGALPRTTGGYSLGGGRIGGVRYFSHTPAAPAQVVHNASAAVRGFWLSGQKAQFDGMTSSGSKRYRTITTLQEETGRKMQNVPKYSPGSFIDFHVNPTVTALSPLGAAFPYTSTMKQDAPTLNTEGFFDVLAVDFARALKDLATVMNDLKKLSVLGDLGITLEERSILRVRFPGCDAETVERLCEEVGVRRGIIHQDPDFDDSVGGQMTLLFPFASTSEHTLSSPGGSLRSQAGREFEPVDEFDDNPWLSSPEGYETMDDLSETESTYFARPSNNQDSSGYEGLEGIYRFIEECDNARPIGRLSDTSPLQLF